MTYSHLLKFNPIGKEIAVITILKINNGVGGERVKNFDQWTEELSKEIFVRSDEEETGVLSRLNQIVDEDYDEE